MAKLHKKHSPLSRSELKLVEAGKAVVQRGELFKVHTDAEGATKTRLIRKVSTDG